MRTQSIVPDRMPPMPVLVGLMNVFGTTQGHLSELIGVPQPKLSRWCRGEQGIEAQYLFLMTATLELMIETAEEGRISEELPHAVRRSLELRIQTARQWLALQQELNEQLPDEARQHALAIYDRLTGARQAKPTGPHKHEARPLAGKQSGSGSVQNDKARKEARDV